MKEVLIVDDNYFNIEVLEAVVKHKFKKQVKVTSALSGLQAISLV